jgi:hypothetical protein
MKWNVVAMVVDVVEAPAKEDAIDVLEGALMEKGFDIYDGATYDGEQAFLSEDQEDE